MTAFDTFFSLPAMPRPGNACVFHYGSRRKDIEADTFLHSLTNITTIIQEVNRELGSGQPLNIKIKAREPGSFEIQLVLLGFFEAIKPLLTVENFKTTHEVMKGVVDLFKLRKEAPKLGTTQTQRGGDIIIEDSDGNQITINQNVYYLYQGNAKVQTALDENFEALEKDPKVTDFSIRDTKGRAFFEAKRNEFPKMLLPGPEIDMPLAVREALMGDEGAHVTVPAKLTVVRPSFQPDLPWDVIFQGNKVSARMDDDDYKARVALRRERFGAGDTLECDFHIRRALDPIANVYVNKSYRILKVHKHVRAGEQLKLTNGFELNHVDELEPDEK